MNQPQRGFTLLEVVVAFAILAMAVTTLLAMFGSGVRNTTLASDYQRALVLAEARMNYLQGIAPNQLHPEIYQGEGEGGLLWRSEVSVYPTEATETALLLYRIDVQTSWRDGGHTRLIELSTLRLVPTP
ncbi:MAG TPA: prepilin-type N-terminal cleavage/methylation domain-containing protein [Gammaproteobacteria bacterium]